jgi:hypothetical protein
MNVRSHLNILPILTYLLVHIHQNKKIAAKIARVMVHTDRTRFGNATRIFNFQLHLTSIFFYVFQIFGTSSAILAIWSKFLSVDGFICF